MVGENFKRSPGKSHFSLLPSQPSFSSFLLWKFQKKICVRFKKRLETIPSSILDSHVGRPGGVAPVKVTVTCEPFSLVISQPALMSVIPFPLFSLRLSFPMRRNYSGCTWGVSIDGASFIIKSPHCGLVIQGMEIMLTDYYYYYTKYIYV